MLDSRSYSDASPKNAAINFFHFRVEPEGRSRVVVMERGLIPA